MANCPKCSCHLRIIDWKQKCPKCGANIVLYDLQERLMKDADKAEVQHYHFQKKLDRLKGSFVGSKLAIARIFTSLLPVLAVLLPFVKIKLSAPFESFEGNVSAITVYKLSEKLDMGAFGSLLYSAATKSAALLMAVSVVMLLLTVVFMLIRFICLMLACSPKGKIRNYTFDAILGVLTVGAGVCFSVIPENSFIAGNVTYGYFVFAAMIAVLIVNDVLVFKQGINITHKPCFVGGIPIEEYFDMLEKNVPQEKIRAEMYRRLTLLQQEKDALLEKEQHEKERKENEEKEKQEVNADE